MPLCQVNIAHGKMQNPDDTAATLRAACAKLTPGAPIILLVHGYKYSPDSDVNDPHALIFALEPRRHWKIVSWPRRLGLGQREHGPEPLCVAVGWHARGTLWSAYDRAAETGAGLADLVKMLRGIRPNGPIHVVAHSLGGRVALSALPYLPARILGRIVLLAAAELQSAAQQHLDCPAGRSVEVLNVKSRENLLFDWLLEWLVAPSALGDRSVGSGLGRPSPGWLDLPVDKAETRAALARLGFRIPAPDRHVCHWSVYLRSGLFDVYRSILTERLTLSDLRAVLPAPASPAQHKRGTWRDLPLPMLRRGAS